MLTSKFKTKKQRESEKLYQEQKEKKPLKEGRYKRDKIKKIKNETQEEKEVRLQKQKEETLKDAVSKNRVKIKIIETKDGKLKKMRVGKNGKLMTGMPPTSDRKKALFIKLLSIDCTEEEACLGACISPKTIRKLKKEDPQFALEVEIAKVMSLIEAKKALNSGLSGKEKPKRGLEILKRRDKRYTDKAQVEGTVDMSGFFQKAMKMREDKELKYTEDKITEGFKYTEDKIDDDTIDNFYDRKITLEEAFEKISDAQSEELLDRNTELLKLEKRYGTISEATKRKKATQAKKQITEDNEEEEVE